MPNKISFNTTFQTLEKAISIAQQRNTVLAGNISNMDTPGYQPKDIDFKSSLANALEMDRKSGLVRTNPRHIQPGMKNADMVESLDEKSNWNGYNWINVDREITKLTENNVLYRTAVEALLRKIAMLKEVIREGGR